MYNKLFTKILDSSIWLESATTRIVWLTFIAAMDEHGLTQFASVGNVAQRARVSPKQAQEAIVRLEGPDPESSDDAYEGRRIERVPGGWLVLNAEKYRHLVTKAVIQEQTRERVRKHREKVKRIGNVDVTADKKANDSVTPSEARAEARSGSEAEAEAKDEGKERSPLKSAADARFARFWANYPNKKGKVAARKAWDKLRPTDADTDVLIAAVHTQQQWPEWTKEGGRFIPHPATWLNAGRWDDEPSASNGAGLSDTARHNIAASNEAERIILDNEVHRGRER